MDRAPRAPSPQRLSVRGKSVNAERRVRRSTRIALLCETPPVDDRVSDAARSLRFRRLSLPHQSPDQICRGWSDGGPGTEGTWLRDRVAV
ncbi:hypothetical protein GCM10023307_23150 [Lysobacter hankyongensis]|uniref:Uncharacterized protein n=1 Tax=Lysobacter hankyongensis TaxID=1176535 RepID=A0ABP9BP23_9GAMM